MTSGEIVIGRSRRQSRLATERDASLLAQRARSAGRCRRGHPLGSRHGRTFFVGQSVRRSDRLVVESISYMIQPRQAGRCDAGCSVFQAVNCQPKAVSTLPNCTGGDTPCGAIRLSDGPSHHRAAAMPSRCHAAGGTAASRPRRVSAARRQGGGVTAMTRRDLDSCGRAPYGLVRHR
jgi:hypothetical protein